MHVDTLVSAKERVVKLDSFSPHLTCLPFSQPDKSSASVDLKLLNTVSVTVCVLIALCYCFAHLKPSGGP